MIERNFATVGNVYPDGVSLIFDGETTETQKHYLCNTSARIAAGDRVKVSMIDGTYIVEYSVGKQAVPVEPEGGSIAIDNHTLIEQGGVVKVNTANDAQQDNTLPITSAAVFAEIGNIDALLMTI